MVTSIPTFSHICCCFAAGSRGKSAMDEENRRALEALQATAPLATTARGRRTMATCPHCHEGFGSASLPIHVRRCRALYPPPESEMEAPDPPPAPAVVRKPLPPLVDLCLRFINKHFESLYVDRIKKLPEAEGALIASMPQDLLHRLIINLANSSKKMRVKEQARRATVEKLQAMLDSANDACRQMESIRRSEAHAVTRMREHEAVAEQTKRDLEIASRERASAEAHNRTLQAQLDSLSKKLASLESKVQSLASQKEELKTSVLLAQKREMEVTKKLAAISKERPQSQRKAVGSSGGSASRRTPRSFDGLQERAASRSDRDRLSQSEDTQQWRVALRKRPRSATSKIPLPRALPDEYRRKLESETERVVAPQLA